ncbi:asphd2 [Symbiodinium natans]|uniref:Asphd2 protein n=1 Tax=Symbiodinium natans TaxID=878477 RepID=A0A812T9G3_9DINO|nr:asphd2 [Symbiodinium natans]
MVEMWRFGIWAAAVLAASLDDTEVTTCVLNLPQCIQLLSEDEASQEQLAGHLLQNWLQRVSADDADTEQPNSLRSEALRTLLDLATATDQHPRMALGLGQVLHSFFWWGDQPRESAGLASPSLQVMQESFLLHERALAVAGCDLSDLETEEFLLRKCPWRWRFVLLIGVELGLELARGGQDSSDVFTTAADFFARLAQLWLLLKRLPFFAEMTTNGPMQLNQNADFFPTARHWPIWPREHWPDLGTFVERHSATFRAGLEALLQEDPEGHHFGATARFQSGLTPRKEDWTRIKLIHSGGQSELCSLPFLQPSCALLAQRSEFGPACGTYLSGASFARLMPGAQLKPHFGTHPRLTLHLGLRAPSGATLTVAGQEVPWSNGKVIIFDDTYMHKVQHRGDEARYILVAWFCHPCDRGWREDRGGAWLQANPLPEWCGAGGPGYKSPPVPGYSEQF